MIRPLLAAVAVVGWLAVAFTVNNSLISGQSSGTTEAAQFVAALIATVAAAVALRWADSLARCSVAFGGAVMCVALVLGEASPATNDAAALPLASTGFYLLVLGAAIAAVKAVAGIRQGHR